MSPAARSPGEVTITIPSFLPSTDFYLAAGTVTVDPVARKVLILHDLATHTHQLPRGRKDWGEDLPATAVHETLEETGHAPRLLAVPLATRATPPLHPGPTSAHHLNLAAAAAAAWFDDTGEVLVPGSARLAEEPFAVMQHFQRDSGALAVVAWFVAVADSAAPRREGTQMADENYESRWAAYAEAEALMVDAAYARVVRRALELVAAVVEEDGAAAVLAAGAGAGAG